MSQNDTQLKEALTVRLTEALAREDTSQMTVRQMREFVQRDTARPFREAVDRLRAQHDAVTTTLPSAGAADEA